MGRSLIIIICGFISLFGYLRGNLSKISDQSIDNSFNHYKTIAAKNISTSAVNYVMHKLNRNREWRASLTNVPFGGGSFNVSVKDRPDIGEEIVQVKAYSTYYNVIDSAIVIMRVRAINERFSRYAYFSNTEPNIYFSTADTLDGPVHTNGLLHFTGTPVFFDYVSSVSSTFQTYGYTNPEFHKGIELGAPSISLPNSISELVAAAQDNGLYVVGQDLWLNFNADGTYNYKTVPYGPWSTASLSDINGVLYSNRDVYVQGIVSGQATVCAGKDIFIEDDITLANNPLINTDSKDILGLVSKRNTVVRDTPQNRIECDIDACVMAVSGAFTVEDIYFTPVGRLQILGGVTQKTRGPIGTTAPTGYKKYYKYDQRLEFISPPYFPIATGSLSYYSSKVKIDIISWWE